MQMQMQIQKPSIDLFLFIIFASLTLTTCNRSSNDLIDECLTQVCSYNEPTTRHVHFPFLIKNESLIPRFCGYPGFDLFCDEDDRLLVDLPNSGVFSVKAIDYGKQELWINDPNNCLPKRLLSHNLSNNYGKSPFVAIQEKVYWLYNCSNDYFKYFSYMKPIRCLSSQSYGVVATPSEIISNATSTMCSEIGLVRVPIGSMVSEGVLYSDLSGDIRVTWVNPECKECFQRGGQCGFKSNSSMEVGCFNLPRHGLPKNAMVAIALAFAAPLALSAACMAYFIARAICYRHRRMNNLASTSPAPEIAPHIPHQTIIINGLDQSTIESYPKVVLGESRRLPKPEDKFCPICLGEYLAKDTLRTLPHCGHCFHAECIDEWLPLNASCPVCRNSPSHLIENSE